MTVYEAFTLFARHGNVSSSAKELIEHQPSQQQLHAACGKLEAAGIEPAQIHEAARLVQDFYQTSEWSQK